MPARTTLLRGLWGCLFIFCTYCAFLKSFFCRDFFLLILIYNFVACDIWSWLCLFIILREKHRVPLWSFKDKILFLCCMFIRVATCHLMLFTTISILFIIKTHSHTVHVASFTQLTIIRSVESCTVKCIWFWERIFTTLENLLSGIASILVHVVIEYKFVIRHTISVSLIVTFTLEFILAVV